MTTEDGFILRLDHILPKNGAPVNKSRPVVFLQHGIMDSSVSFTINSPDKAVAFQLVDAGFDVWMGNNRGNKYSLGHKTLTVKDKEYWDQVDFEEMGLYDQPAFIDHVLQSTNRKKLDAYIGHSMGTTQFFIGEIMKPDYYHEKVDFFVALAPGVRLEHTTIKTLRALAYFSQ